MPPPTANPRPIAPIDAARAVEISRRIASQQRGTLASGLAQVAIGVPTMFIAPLVLGTIFWIVAWNLLGFYPWSWFFWGMTAITIPSMLMGEARQRGGWFAGGNPDVSIGGTDGAMLSPALTLMGDSGMLLAFAINPRLEASGLVEIFLFGPRLTLDGLTKLRRLRQLRGTSTDRAADVVARLAQFETGLRLQSLLNQGETTGSIVPVLCLLILLEWIGVSKTGDGVWLLSDARKRLAN